MEEKYRLSPLAKKTCETCPLREHPAVTNQVPTEYINRPTEVMFIAEAPGRTEDERGRPVVGVSGMILRRLVRLINDGTQNGVAYGNIVRCRPADEAGKDRPPIVKEINACKTNILLDVQELKPKVIVLCGKSAAYLALDPITKEPVGTSDTAVSKLRGRWFIVRTPDGTEYPAIVTFHFAYVARNPPAGSVFRQDIIRAFLRARGKLPDFGRKGKPVKILKTVAEVKQLLGHMVKNLTKQDVVTMDYETATGINRIGSRITVIGFAYDNDQGYVIPYHHKESPWSKDEFEQVKALLIKFFTTDTVSFGSLVCHNLKFESAITLDEFGIYLDAFPLEDTLLRAHALNEDREAVLGKNMKALSLKTLAYEWLGFDGYKEDGIAAVVKDREDDSVFGDIPLEQLAEYNGIDCYVTHRLYEYEDLIAEFEDYKDKLKLLGRNLHGPVSVYAAQMERNGIRIDKEKLQFYMTADSPITKRLRQIEEKLYSLDTTKRANELLLQRSKKVSGMQGIWGSKRAAPWMFTINKEDAKKALYVDVLGLVTDTTETGKPKIDAAFYKKNKGIQEIDLLAEWTALFKLKGTYIDGVYRIMTSKSDMQDGRIRAQFNFHVARTGRTSSDSPNMQNIPKGKTPMAKLIKSLYTVDPGYVMVCGDYSQAEVRWWAEVSADRNLLAAFNKLRQLRVEYLQNPTKENRDRILEAGDIHRQTAAQLNKKSPRDITDKERNDAKSIVFGLTYGMSAFGLAARLNCSVSEAENYIKLFFNQFMEATQWLSWIEQNGFDAMCVDSPIFRRRHLVSKFTVGSRNVNRYNAGGEPRYLSDVERFLPYENRICRNAPIQAVASDTNLMACIKIQRYINENRKDWRLINIVHDSIIAEVPFHEVKEYIDVAHEIMVDPNIFSEFGFDMKVPFEAEFTIGPNWGEQIDVKITESYKIKCRDCQKDRKENDFPKNRRCEECGSQNIELSITEGPIDRVLSYLDYKYRYSDFWKQAQQ